MKLIGSSTSPYVRRLRIWLDKADYEFEELDIYSPQGREVLRQYTPVMKIPVLVDGDQSVLDSRLIHRYLSEKFEFEALSWQQQNTLTTIDAANDAYIIRLLLARSNVDPSGDGLLMNLQGDRVQETMAVLEAKVAAAEFERWDYPAICLYCLLDWVDFRELLDLSLYPNLAAFHEQACSKNIVRKTDPRTLSS